MTINGYTTPELDKAIKKIKRPPFDFDIPESLEKDINDLIECIEALNWLDVDIYEDQVHSSLRDIRDRDLQYRMIDYYAYKGWMEDDGF